MIKVKGPDRKPPRRARFAPIVIGFPGKNSTSAVGKSGESIQQVGRPGASKKCVLVIIEFD